ncbi:MAG: hypothetical protein U9O96_05980 [Candidatus Thermoplasmatota archaeon]|nr:hypothetical protein [Candidatus Thermoplasmatota archaeon]
MRAIQDAMKNGFNYGIAKTAIKCKTNFCDLGGNIEIVGKEISLHDRTGLRARSRHDQYTVLVSHQKITCSRNAYQDGGTSAEVESLTYCFRGLKSWKLFIRPEAHQPCRKHRELDYKTIRYSGHCDKIRFLKDTGFFDCMARQFWKRH